MKIFRCKNYKHSKRKPNKKKNGIKYGWSKETCAAIGYTVVAGIDDCKTLNKCLIKIRSFPGATCSDMYHYLFHILERKPDHVILHVGKNDVALYEGTEIVDKLLELKSFIVEKLPTAHVFISHPITRTDSKHLAMKTVDIQPYLRKLEIGMIDNGKINSNHLNSTGFLLNSKGVL